MKKMTAIMITAMMVFLATAVVVTAQEVDVRGQVTTVNMTKFTWDTSSFAGFYYDIDKNLGQETLTFYPTGQDAQDTTATLSDQQNSPANTRGVVYFTQAQNKTFKLADWGNYKVIGFLADRYFAAYNPATYLYDQSTNRNLMTNEQLSKLLIDDNTEQTITSANPLKLQEGYVLAIKSIDVKGNKAYLELSKNGQVVDSKVVQPSIDGATLDDKTYYYKTTIGDTKNVIQIAVHFKNAFAGTDTNIATVDGEFQVSDTATPVKADQVYDKMTISNVNPSALSVTMDNKDNAITLSRNKDVVLMQNVHIKTADQSDASATNPLRFYIYKAYTAPGTYQIRGTVKTVNVTEASWDPNTFAGFYYDIDKNIGTEKLTFYPTGQDAQDTTATLSDQQNSPANTRGVVYFTQAQNKTFKLADWGNYKVIGFLADRYFAAYNPATYLFDKSTNRNLMTNEQLSKLLIDDNTEQTITSATPLKLQEGYELAVKSIDVDGNKVYVELTKNGQVVDDKVIQPSITNATLDDKTYYYKTSIGDTQKIAQIAIHFKNAFRGSDSNIATVDGEFQVSDNVTPVKADQVYDKMTINNVNPSALSVTMDNKDNAITLSRNKDVVLMQNVHIKTADQSDASATNPLRFYIYKAATIAAGNATAPAAAAAPAAAPAANVTANVTAPAKPAPENVTKPANVTAPAANATKPANATAAPANATKPAATKTPGFEGIFAITGLIAVAYQVLGRKR